jgi:hypothetical protein
LGDDDGFAWVSFFKNVWRGWGNFWETTYRWLSGVEAS